MRKKATLLIKNLYSIYTMDEQAGISSILNHGFLAIHHDEILDVGTHDYMCYVDKDTRILDGTNHIAVPAFIEIDAHLPVEDRFDLRHQDEFFMRYMYNGTLLIHTSDHVCQDLEHNYHYEIMHTQTPKESEQIIYALQQLRGKHTIDKKAFCISCHDEHISLQNQMMAAQLLAMKEGISAYELLKALTIYPAEYLGLHNLGCLVKGMKANVLILSTEDIHHFFYSFDQHQIAQIIHKGVRIFPNLLI